ARLEHEHVLELDRIGVVDGDTARAARLRHHDRQAADTVAKAVAAGIVRAVDRDAVGADRLQRRTEADADALERDVGRELQAARDPVGARREVDDRVTRAGKLDRRLDGFGVVGRAVTARTERPYIAPGSSRREVLESGRRRRLVNVAGACW